MGFNSLVFSIPSYAEAAEATETHVNYKLHFYYWSHGLSCYFELPSSTTHSVILHQAPQQVLALFLGK